MKAENYILLITISLTGFFSVGCKRPVNTLDTPVRNVILTEIEQNNSSISNSYDGVVEEGKNVNAAFMTGGKLLSLKAKEGDRVTKGQLLATLDDTDYHIGVNQLQVQFDQMTAEKKRMDEMFTRHNIAPNDYEKFETGYKQLKLQLEMAKNKLDYTRLYSPSDGFISYRYMQPGELVDAGTPIYKIVDDSSLEVSVNLPLHIYLKRDEITNISGSSPNIGETIPLSVVSFIPDADNNQLYQMKLEISPEYKSKLTTGMNMKVDVEMKNNEDSTSLVPSRSLFYENGDTYVWIFNDIDSTISKKKVVVKDAPHGNTSIVAGIPAHAKIASAGVKQLTEGEKVNVVESPLK
ncbi:MAG: efflux RND transporter periplasmic adaptor subunit [Muribaculaceae bacterium]|nr:efflux RND transporter periplasmic adaptor subunit [Muribaculaceae bacterium]